jgi:hypothetical protein
LLLGAVLAPTDPVVTSTVVTSARVPAAVRHVLNLESGLNDGLALPFVLVFLLVAQRGGDAAASAADVVIESLAGVAVGLADTTIGNGPVATFVSALVLGGARQELPRAFPRFNENLSTILQIVRAAGRASGRDRGFVLAQRACTARADVRCLVRTQERRADPVRAVCPGVPGTRPLARLQHRRVRDPRLGARARAHGHRRPAGWSEDGEVH